MSTAAIPKRRNASSRALPIVAFFEDDQVARTHLPGVQRLRRMSVESLTEEHLATERIVLVSS